MKKEKEKRVGIKYLIGHNGSVVSASQAKGRGSIPSCGTSFFSHKYFLSSLSNLRRRSN